MRAQPVDAVDRARLRYPEHLPVVERRDDILAAIRDHQVVVLAGETGSGKTTQLPKMCLELGLGSRGQVGHTQPRRIAARSVAERIAEEMEVELGDLIGYQVRFTDRSSDATRVKVMTDGILLNEMQRDRDLRRYDTIIIDEAHERSLNIDFILGYLKQLLPRRPDLKVVVTSATIDPERFARHFATDERGHVVREVPVIEVSGRTFPVEVRYRPLVELHPDGRHVVAERDQVTGVVEAVEELWTETPPSPEATDILAFFSGEREIRDAAEALGALRLPNTEVLPLFARLSAAEQHRVFHRGGGRRIILATNVAETSLTVPGIGYVIDTGTARISRYSQRTKVQRLPIEPVSRASAAQRAGRCGRVAPGVCIRLYSEEDLEARPEFTEPEIQRTSLAAVILQMTALGLGDVTRFPFVDAPDARQVADGVRLLEELGAFSTDEQARGRHRGRGRRLTASGRTLARLPLDPRLGRMVVEAGRLGCTREVLVIVSALSIQDPRERPVDREAQADQSHARFTDDRSDFATLHTLWRYLKDQQKALSHSAFRRMCKSEYLHYLRIREWQDLHGQLRSACRSVRIDPDLATAAATPNPTGTPSTGRCSPGSCRTSGPRPGEAGLPGAAAPLRHRPGSALFRRQPDLVMAAELVETTPAVGAGHRARSSPSGPRRSARTSSPAPSASRAGAAGGGGRRDRAGHALRGAARPGPHDPVRPGRPRGGPRDLHPVRARRGRLGAAARVLGAQRRHAGRGSPSSRSGPVGATSSSTTRSLFAFYDARIPPDVLTERHFDRWWRGERRRRPDLLTLTEELLTSDAGEQVSAADYPRTWRQGDLELDVDVPVLAGRGGRRGHRARAGRRAQPGDLRGVRLAGARAARRPRGGAAQVASEGDQPPLRPDAGPRGGGSSLTPTRRAAVHRGAGPGARRAHRHPHPSGGVGPRPRARPPADHLQRRGRGREGGGAREGPRGAAPDGRRRGPGRHGARRGVAGADRPHGVDGRRRCPRRSRAAPGD